MASNALEHWKAGLAVANADKPLAKLDGDPAPILARLRDGESVKVVAESLGIKHVALYEFLIRHCPDEWRAISSGKALARIEQAEQDMDSADDQVKIAKARESHRMGAWTAERVARSIYGDIKNPTGDVTVQVLVQRGDAEPVAVSANVLRNDQP